MTEKDPLSEILSNYDSRKSTENKAAAILKNKADAAREEARQVLSGVAVPVFQQFVDALNSRGHETKLTKRIEGGYMSPHFEFEILASGQKGLGYSIPCIMTIIHDERKSGWEVRYKFATKNGTGMASTRTPLEAYVPKSPDEEWFKKAGLQFIEGVLSIS